MKARIRDMTVDFVILWLDGSDVEWQREKYFYSNAKEDSSTAANRFRDWDNLHYWFRSVEKNASWVNKIHFVTYGHLPKWLNTDHPKIHIVYHTQILKREWCPTFNSSVLVTNLFRIPDLSEHFVLFNDDMFVLQPLNRAFFFSKDGLPMDRAIQTALIPDNSGIFHIRSNNLAILNKHFKKKDCWKKNWKKYLSIRYGADLYRNIALLPWSNWTGFYDDHLPASYLKSSFEKIWSLEEEFLSKASGCRFRSRDDYSEWLMRYYQYAKGLFTPCAKRGKFFDLESIADVQYASEQILQNTMKMACFNDSLKNESFEDAKSLLNASLEKLFPKKSEFEK